MRARPSPTGAPAIRSARSCASTCRPTRGSGSYPGRSDRGLPAAPHRERRDTMAVEVAKVELMSVQDASGLEERILAGQSTADQVIAVIGKTEGNGGVNDFTRLLADHAFRRVLLKHGKRSEAEVATIPMVWSGGCDGVITPHATVFARNDRKGTADKPRLQIATAITPHP